MRVFPRSIPRSGPTPPFGFGPYPVAGTSTLTLRLCSTLLLFRRFSARCVASVPSVRNLANDVGVRTLEARTVHRAAQRTTLTRPALRRALSAAQCSGPTPTRPALRRALCHPRSAADYPDTSGAEARTLSPASRSRDRAHPSWTGTWGAAGPHPSGVRAIPAHGTLPLPLRLCPTLLLRSRLSHGVSVRCATAVGPPRPPGG